MAKYIHRVDPEADLIAEALRVYRTLDRSIPDRPGLEHNFYVGGPVLIDDTEKIKRTLEEQDGAISAGQLFLAFIVTDECKGRICTYEKDSLPGKERGFTLRVSYDTRKKGELIIETPELTEDDLTKRLAA
jgi:hypothetical protein